MHNDYLWILAETGIVGLAAYLYGLVLVGRVVLQRALRHHRLGDPAVAAAFPALVAFAVVSFAENPIENFSHFGVVVFALAGLVAREAVGSTSVRGL